MGRYKQSKVDRRSPEDKIKDAGVYTARAEYLKALGFNNYGHYLSSDLWRDIRKTVLESRPGCRGCKLRSASQVHHRSYLPGVLSGDELDDLVPLCAGCHKHIEFDKRGCKLSIRAAEEKLVKLLYSPPRRPGRKRKNDKSDKKACGVCGSSDGCAQYQLPTPKCPKPGEKQTRKLCKVCRVGADVVATEMKQVRTYNGTWGALKVKIKKLAGTTGQNLFREKSGDT